MRDERDQIKELKKQIWMLEHALAKERIRIHNLCWRSLVEVIDEKYGIDSKKTLVRSCRQGSEKSERGNHEGLLEGDL